MLSAASFKFTICVPPASHAAGGHACIWYTTAATATTLWSTSWTSPRSSSHGTTAAHDASPIRCPRSWFALTKAFASLLVVDDHSQTQGSAMKKQVTASSSMSRGKIIYCNTGINEKPEHLRYMYGFRVRVCRAWLDGQCHMDDQSCFDSHAQLRSAKTSPSPWSVQLYSYTMSLCGRSKTVLKAFTADSLTVSACAEVACIHSFVDVVGESL